MAYTLNGIGTTFYGQRDFLADGTHITTEWLVFLYVPLIPLRSLRVRYQGVGEHRWYLGLGSSENYAVYEKRFPPIWKQVFYTYGYVALLAGWLYLVVSSAFSLVPLNTLNNTFGIWLFFFLLPIVCLIPVPTPWILRYYARRKLRS